MKNYQITVNLLENLRLRGILPNLDSEIADAEQQKISYLSFLNNILNLEIKHRTEMKLKRNLSGAHFPIIKTIESYDFNCVKGITRTDIANLMDFNWIDMHENLLFFGPPGLGKSHLTIAIAYKAIESGYSVCFEKITSLIKLLKTSEIQRTAAYRINRILKSQILAIDEVGYTPIERKEANLFFNLISELYEKSSIIITSNKSFDEWAEMMGDEIMTTAMLDRLLHHSRIFNLTGDSYRIKNLKK
jgi:DNA replication protein DnaC